MNLSLIGSYGFTSMGDDAIPESTLLTFCYNHFMNSILKANKIVIIGISGTGKTTFARKLSDLLSIPLIHYDELVWGENWQEVDEKIVEEALKKAMKKKKWILEGYIHPAAKYRLEQADQVIYLDYSGAQAAWGGFQRWWQHRGKTRVEMAPGCIERFKWSRLKLMFARGERPEIQQAIEGFENKMIRLSSRREMRKFLSAKIPS